MTELKEHVITGLARKLDESRTGIKDWTFLATNIAQNLSIPVEEIKSKYTCGSPGKTLLHALKSKKPDLTVGQFSEVAEDLGRNDIVKLLENTDTDDLLHELDEDIQNKLVPELEKVGSEAVRNWRSFCDELDIHEDEIKARVQKEGSPTVDLIRLITSHRTDYTVYDLRTELVAISRYDVVKYIDSVVVKIISGQSKRIFDYILFHIII